MTEGPGNGRVILAAACLVAVLAVAGGLRLRHVADIGLTGCDPFIYSDEAIDWAQGNRHSLLAKLGYNYLGAMAVTALGPGDQVLHVLNAVMDTATVALVFCIGLALRFGPGVSLAGAAWYTFLPRAVILARSGYPQTAATTLLAMAVLCLILSWRSRRYGFLCAFLCGLAGAFAGFIHPSLLPMGPVLALLCALVATPLADDTGTWVLRPLGRFLAVGLGGVACLVYFGGLMAPSGGTSLDGILAVVDGWVRQQAINIQWFQQNAPDMGTGQQLTAMLRALPTLLSWPYLLGGAVLAASSLFPGAVADPRQAGGKTFMTALLWTVPLVILGLYLSLVGGDPDLRFYLPALPLLIPAICQAGARFSRRAPTARPALVWTAVVVLAMAANVPQLADATAPNASIYRQVHDAIGESVDADNRLLVTPYTAYNVYPGFRHRLYFGDDARYILHQDQGESLEGLVQRQHIRYVIVAPALHDARLLTRERDLLGAAYGMRPEDYTPQRDREAVTALLSSMGAVSIVQGTGYEVWDLSPSKNPQTRQQ